MLSIGKHLLFVVCLAAHVSNGLKSRTRPDSGKCIAEQQGCHELSIDAAELKEKLMDYQKILEFRNISQK